MVTHDETLDYRIEEVEITTSRHWSPGPWWKRRSVKPTGALLLVIQSATGESRANPTPDTRLNPHTILITHRDLNSTRRNTPPRRRSLKDHAAQT